MFDADVVVIGGGPAGLAAAIAARGKGLRTIVLDSQRAPIDKPCGEGLLPRALLCAERAGFPIPTMHGAPIEGLCFRRGRHSVEASFPSCAGLGMRRVKLHELLVTRAAAANAELRWGVPVIGVDNDRVLTGQGSLRARWIVAADGERSRLRSRLGLDVPPRHVRYAFRQHYQVKPWSRDVEVYWGDGVQVYVTPAGPDEVGIAMIAASPARRLLCVLPEFPALMERLHGARQSSPEKGSVITTRALPRVSRGKVLLVGDASGTVDAITGEGIGLAFEQALVLASAMEQGSSQAYELAHRRLMRRPRAMGELLLACGSGRLAVPLLAAQPWLFRRLVALHARAE